MRHDVERKMRSITDIELSGRKVFMRLDLNVPLKNGAITSDARIRAASPIITSDATVPAGYMGLDIGPKTRDLIEREARGAATVFWNGPMGVCEGDNFAAGTNTIAAAMAANAGYTVRRGSDGRSTEPHSGGDGAKRYWKCRDL
jgi:3-phosphoglycerate kinase